MAILTSVALLVACDRREIAPPPAPQVLVVEVTERDVPIVAEWLGTTEGFVDAEIRSQVSGYLVARDYQEGMRVSKGDLLFRIDPRPYREALARARADLAGARASLALAEDDARRAEHLYHEDVISRQQLESQSTRRQTAGAGVQAAEAAAEKARLDLEYAEIRSPIDGIVGVAIRQLGDFVAPTDSSPLTTVSQLDPIRVSFPVSEHELLLYSDRIQEAVRSGAFPAGAEQLILLDGTVYPHRGTGHPAGREVDPLTGTILVKGVFPNPDLVLRPGQYARIRVEMGALVVPERAIQDLQGLSQLTLVGADDEVEVRIVETGALWGTLRVITSGVSPGERVVVEGFQKVRPGMVVLPSPAPPGLAGAPPPEPPGSRAPIARAEPES